MKKLMLIVVGLLCLTLNTFAATDSNKIEQVANELGKLLPSTDYKLKPIDADKDVIYSFNTEGSGC